LERVLSEQTLQIANRLKTNLMTHVSSSQKAKRPKKNSMTNHKAPTPRENVKPIKRCSVLGKGRIPVATMVAMAKVAMTISTIWNAMNSEA
jgi:hypothetical protein